jgi:hypothetical protein
VTVSLSPVPEFSVGFLPLNLARRQSKSEKGNPINESQCQNQNPRVPKSSAYDNYARVRCVAAVRKYIDQNANIWRPLQQHKWQRRFDSAGSYKVSYAKFVGMLDSAFWLLHRSSALGPIRANYCRAAAKGPIEEP